MLETLQLLCGGLLSLEVISFRKFRGQIHLTIGTPAPLGTHQAILPGFETSFSEASHSLERTYRKCPTDPIKHQRRYENDSKNRRVFPNGGD